MIRLAVRSKHIHGVWSFLCVSLCVLHLTKETSLTLVLHSIHQPALTLTLHR